MLYTIIYTCFMFKGEGDYQMKNVVSHNISTLLKAPTLRYKILSLAKMCVPFQPLT
jgi:hypothetical protein